MSATTNTVKHTPTRGPWNFDGNCGGYISDADGVKIGRAYSHADAHVFAAAPDLLEALHLIDAYLYVTAPKSNERDIVLRAISKATGSLAPQEKGGE